VLHHPAQGQVGRRQRPHQLVVVEATGLAPEDLALLVEEPRQVRDLVAASGPEPG
jgi:hypothetical protein